MKSMYALLLFVYNLSYEYYDFVSATKNASEHIVWMRHWVLFDVCDDFFVINLLFDMLIYTYEIGAQMPDWIISAFWYILIARIA